VSVNQVDRPVSPWADEYEQENRPCPGSVPYFPSLFPRRRTAWPQKSENLHERALRARLAIATSNVRTDAHPESFWRCDVSEPGGICP